MFVYILHRHTCRQHPYIISLRMVEVTKTFGLGLCPPHMNVCTNIHIKILNEGIEGKGGVKVHNPSASCSHIKVSWNIVGKSYIPIRSPLFSTVYKTKLHLLYYPVPAPSLVPSSHQSLPDLVPSLCCACPLNHLVTTHPSGLAQIPPL